MLKRIDSEKVFVVIKIEMKHFVQKYREENSVYLFVLWLWQWYLYEKDRRITMYVIRYHVSVCGVHCAAWNTLWTCTFVIKFRNVLPQWIYSDCVLHLLVLAGDFRSSFSLWFWTFWAIVFSIRFDNSKVHSELCFLMQMWCGTGFPFHGHLASNVKRILIQMEYSKRNNSNS